MSIDAAVDFSGGIPQVLKLENISTKEEETQLFHQLEVVSANGAMISTSVGRQYRYTKISLTIKTFCLAIFPYGI